MKEFLNAILRLLGRKELLIALTLTLAGYIALERWGLFRVEPALYREIFHSLPVEVLSVLFALNALCGLVSVVLMKGLRGKRGYICFLLSIILLVSALLTSVYTRFEGKTIVREGGSFTAFPSEYIRQTLYMPEERRAPQFGLTVLKVTPETSEDMQVMERVSADVLYLNWLTNKIEQGRVGSSRPLFNDWTFVRVTDFGYTLSFKLLSIGEKELEKQHFDLKLFPAGAEDSFEAMFLGYVFHVRCYPDFNGDRENPGTLSAYPKNPVFNLRIVRNKDIVYNGLIDPTQKVRFDNHVITLPNARMWIEMGFVRDLGLPVAAGAGILLLVGVVFMIARKLGRTEERKKKLKESGKNPTEVSQLLQRDL